MLHLMADILLFQKTSESDVDDAVSLGSENNVKHSMLSSVFNQCFS